MCMLCCVCGLLYVCHANILWMRYVLRIDVFLYDGAEALFLVALALLRLHQPAIPKARLCYGKPRAVANCGDIPEPTCSIVYVYAVLCMWAYAL